MVAPRSIHPDTGKPYRVANDGPMAPAPQWVLNLYKEKPKPKPIKHNHFDDIDSLPIKDGTKSLIRHGAAKGNRSEAMWKALCGLVWSNLSDADISSIFNHYPIGEKYLEKHDTKDRWLQMQVDKARGIVSDRLKDRPETGLKRKPVNNGAVNLVCASSINPEAVNWLWNGWLAAGKIHILAGIAGHGKSTILFTLAATISIGGRWPDGTRAPVGDVVVLVR